MRSARTVPRAMLPRPALYDKFDKYETCVRSARAVPPSATHATQIGPFQRPFEWFKHSGGTSACVLNCLVCVTRLVLACDQSSACL